MNPEAGLSMSGSEFNGKRILVTGGTKGIGEAIAKRLSSAGATVITTARSAPADDGSALFIEADLGTAEGAEKVIREVLERHGGVDILINNVGGSSAPAVALPHSVTSTGKML